MSAETEPAPLIFAILDPEGRVCAIENPDHAEELAARAARLNARTPGYRVAALAEIPAWRPIATALKDGSVIRVGKAGGTTGEVRWDGRAWASATWSECVFLAPEFWQPLPAAPEVESCAADFDAPAFYARYGCEGPEVES
jgi:hypothetical protein